MKRFLPRMGEPALLAALIVLAAVAVWAPSLVQPARYHDFADARHWWGIPHALDVLSNAAFVGMGVALIKQLHRLGALRAPLDARSGLVLFLALGLCLTAAGSAAYHWAPDDAGLALDRLGMCGAFAAVLGLAAQDRVSDRAGWSLAALVFVAAPAAVGVWWSTQNLAPWAVVQGGGMLLLVAFALSQPRAGHRPIAWGWVVLAYVLAKGVENHDHAIFNATAGWLSGHNLKHVLAALAIWPVCAALRPAHNRPSARPVLAKVST